MAQRPVVFLAFANDQDAHLDMLKKESRDIYRTLQDLHDKQFIEIYREESADIEDIFHNFNRFKDRVAIFHYGGHASGTQLRLEGVSANASGLATLFSNQANLQVVVLNGCSTLEQVNRLLELGVKAVVATSVEVQDDMATEFATQFYAGLAVGKNIKASFTQAMAFLQTKYGHARGGEIYRSVVFRKPKEEAEKVEIPWGLYMKEGADSVLEYSLPAHKKVELPERFGGAIKQNYRIGEYIVTVLEAMAQHNKAIYREMEDEFGDPRDPREFPELIIKNFPWPIGSQLRILVANSDMMNKPGIPRLRQLAYTYVVTSQFLCYILLAQLWDVIVSGKFALDQELKARLADLIPEKTDRFDFVTLMINIGKTFRQYQITPFITEFEALFDSLDKKDAVFDAYEFLEGVRAQINDGSAATSDLDALCNQTEFCLSEFLKKVAFLAKYRLITVKDIELVKPKHRGALFRVQMGVLNALDKEFLREKAKDQEGYTDTHSVLVVKNLKEMTEYLNLSPFLIDKNAFAGKPIPNIYLYNCKRGTNYQYLSVNFNINKDEPDPLDMVLTDDPVYDMLGEQFQLFLG
jgi:hypothetical protein